MKDIKIIKNSDIYFLFIVEYYIIKKDLLRIRIKSKKKYENYKDITIFLYEKGIIEQKYILKIT